MPRTHARIGANKLCRDSLAGFKSGRIGHVDQYVTEFVADACAVEGDTNLDDRDDPSSVRPIWKGVQVRTDVRGMILLPMSSQEEQGLTAALFRPAHRPPGMTKDWNIC